ncbi:universal stress protein [Halobacteriaceae archaeon GCM10025711]
MTAGDSEHDEKQRMHVIVAVDGSQVARDALDRALDVADGLDGAVTVVHSVDPAVYDAIEAEPVGDRSEAERRDLVESIEDAERRGEELLRSAAAHAEERGVAVETALLYGDPVATVLDYVADHDADAVYVGHRNLPEPYERVLGSVAKGILEGASVPVTVVR